MTNYHDGKRYLDDEPSEHIEALLMEDIRFACDDTDRRVDEEDDDLHRYNRKITHIKKRFLS